MSNLGVRWQYRHGIKGLNGVGRVRGLAQDLSTLVPVGDTMTFDASSGVVYDASGGTIDISTLPPTDQAAFLDQLAPAPVDVAGSMTMGLPNGALVDLTGATQQYDAASGQSYTLAADGTKIYDDGTVIFANGDIMTPGGTVVHADGSLTLTNGDRIPGATPTADGATVADTLAQWLKTGGTLATGVLSALGKLGISAPAPVARALGTRPGTGWINSSQYRMANGIVVTPTKLPNGLYQLPDGSTVGAPRGSGGLGRLVGLGLAGVLTWAAIRGFRGRAR